ncbi:hypothetical protein DNTS_013385 [Danionella cerebrum]|uniref:Kinesin-like protein n=1 Tax=Danionella cerebrum TaxID=2873325 RepID=A0A553PW57_9TELE|nr:hypothetical protein DNTS_013385 [Danionella translucida]
MYLNNGAENVSMSLNFMGRKLRNHTVAPAAKQRAWESTALSHYEEDAGVCPRVVLSHPSVSSEELPGSIPDLREELQQHRPCNIHHTLLDHGREQTNRRAAKSEVSWLRKCRLKWNTFRHWIGTDHHREANARGASKRHPEDEMDIKMFIPYDSAKLCITQITSDMMAMKSKHQEVIQEMKENFVSASRDNQTLEDLNESLQLQQKMLEDKNEKVMASWDKEKNKMMDQFSSRLDILHSHQASTLQELHLARAEMGKVQEILQSIQEKKEEQNCTEEQISGETNEPLDGAQAHLLSLTENLLKRERELSMLMAEQKRATGAVEQSAYAHLLTAVIQQSHQVYAALTEAKEQFDKMAEDNQKELVEIKEKLEQTVKECDEKSPEEEEDVQQKMEDVQMDHAPHSDLLLHEVIQVALECIRSGAKPTLIGSVASEEWTAELDERVRLKQIKDDNKKVIENYTTERTLRKKYYNMVEDMKGKIRVFCRIRPLTRAEQAKKGQVVITCLDDYSVILETPRGPREFQFDKIFNSQCTQEEIFTESSGLIQCAIDGFNVCIFAYGHTGSGKTFTMVGDRDRRNPGIIPRTFTKIFEIIQDNESKFDFKVSAYMLELYNDRLQDLFVTPAEAFNKRIEIKRDRKGLVFAQGAEMKDAASAGELFALFEQGCANRHIAATKMNVESSRSHLIIGIMIESRNLTNGSVSFGKLSLVDLAGSERAAKTGAKDDQLKEANSINKSLSALGDVISALSLEQTHVPYRNNKLTQLMQDSLGGNAKTLMILNISPSDGTLDETLTSLIYATRVKAITNNAQRNIDSKEIAQLKEVILKLKSGQPVEEDI